MAKAYKVGPHQAIKVDRVYHKPGAVLPDGCTPAAIQMALEKGLIHEVDQTPPVAVKPPVQVVPIPTRVSQAPVAQQPRSKWTLDPETLRAKPLPLLNVMIRERDQSVKPFETVEEAVAFLTQDWQPPKEKI